MIETSAMTEPLSMDQAFIRKLTDIVSANLHDENFSVEKLAEQAGMSRISVHRRIKAIKNQDASQFIREVRLKHALEMLHNNEGTVAEIAFRVGFGSATYFNKCFHEYFGFPPGEVRKRESSESLKNYADAQSLKSPIQKELKPKEAVESESKKLHHKNILIASLGILSGLLILYFLYVLLIQDSGSRQRTKNPEKSIVVLPFKNLSDDPENQYFADGIMEDILNHLFRIKELNVRSSTTAEHFRENLMTSPQIARELSVNYVLEGSVFKSENKVRIFVQLIDAKNDQHILSEKYEGQMTNIFELQGDIAKKVANTLEAALSREEIGQIEKMPTNSPEAYDYYLKARFLVNKANDEQRVDINMEGACLFYPERRFEEACRELLVSIRLNPNLSIAHQWYAQLLMITGPIEEARVHMDRVLELEPYFWVAHNLNSWICYFEEKHKKGIDACLTGFDLNPHSLDNDWLFFLHYVKLGEGEKAAKALQNIAIQHPGTSQNVNEIFVAYDKSGIKGLFTWLIGSNIHNPIPLEGMNGHPFYIAWWYALLDEKEESLNWLGKVHEAQYIPYHYFDLITTNPDFDFLRNDSRFIKIIEEFGLTPYNTRKAK